MYRQVYNPGTTTSGTQTTKGTQTKRRSQGSKSQDMVLMLTPGKTLDIPLNLLDWPSLFLGEMERVKKDDRGVLSAQRCKEV